jgi:hypothetical protein
MFSLVNEDGKVYVLDRADVDRVDVERERERERGREKE